jgi:5-hydroxyisourate hydrolase
MATLSTHVLDTSSGRPASGVDVVLESADGAVLATGTTAADGRIGSLGNDLVAGEHRLRFTTSAHSAFYTEVVVVFVVADDDHYHVPLLLSPFGYSTYRGS